MLPDLRQRLVELLKEYTNVFAWSYRDMSGLETTIVEHKLPLMPNAVPIWQQFRRMKTKVALKIKEEVEKQWNASFLVVAEYLQWVANSASPQERREGLNASPKNNFLLPHINMLVDNTTQHAFYSFMDGFSGYNQIWMVVEDREKTTFITTSGTF
ncbi:hypothetical protein CR513_34761, partial [Mucuna pruriens]